MKNENEIKSLSLAERQKLVIDLKQTPAGDKFYPRAQQMIAFITSMKDWTEPETVEVKNVAGHDLTIDDKKIERGATARVYPWQFSAVARYFEMAGKAAALLAFALIVLGANIGRCQNQAFVLGSANVYNVESVAGLSGGTNIIVGTNSFAFGVTNYTYITNVNWNIVNGLPTNTPTITTNSAVNVPGIVSVVNYGLFDLFWGFQLTSSGTSTATMAVDYSPDSTNWALNALTVSLVASGTTFVSTNVSLSNFAPGYIRMNTIGYPSVAVTQTNIVVEVARKPSLTGP